MKPFSLKLTISCIILLLFLVSCAEDASRSNEIESGMAMRNVEVATVQRKDFVIGLRSSGRIENDNPINISSSLPLRIEKIHVREGDKVQKGKLLVELNSINLEQAELSYRNMETNYLRMEELLKRNAIDQKTFDEFEMAYKIAKLNYEYTLENTMIIAPSNGVITSVPYSEGEMINPMISPFLIRMLSSGVMIAVTNLSDADYAKTRLNLPAYAVVNSYPDEEFSGSVRYISNEADALSGTFRCEILINDPMQKLKHNQFAHLFIATAESQNTLVIPQIAMVDDKSVFVVRNGKAVKVTVETGIGNASEIEILKGLEEGDQVITVGSMGLTDDYPINIIN